MKPHAGLFSAILKPPQIITAADAIAPYAAEQRGSYAGAPAVVLLPETAAEVAAIMRVCAAHRLSVVPQGGNTGLVGGSVANTDTVLINFKQMQRIRSLRGDAFAMTVEAGCTLEQVQQAAANADLYFPLGLSVAPQCQIGGNISTNAGGINVLRYGMTRALVLGLEVVLADGTLWSDLEPCRKKNEGADLKQLFIGSEGSLGLITAATLALQAKPRQDVSLLVERDSVAALLKVYAALQRDSNHTLSAFEFITPPCWRLLKKTRPAITLFHETPVALVKLTTSTASNLFDLSAFAASLSAAHGIKRLSHEAAAAYWHARSELPWAQRDFSPSIKHDVAVPLDKVADFLERAAPLVTAQYPDALLIAFGHLGDGNVHYNIAVADLQRKAAVNEAVFTLARSLGGSISAEHGIGLVRRADYLHLTDAQTVALQHKIKTVFDPLHHLNPGKSAGGK